LKGTLTLAALAAKEAVAQRAADEKMSAFKVSRMLFSPMKQQ
jgi:hypothetical protein